MTDAPATEELTIGMVARAHRATEPLHSLIYFAPEGEDQYTFIGLRPGRMGYFASRSAAMGPVAGGVTAATFYNFNPELVARHIPRAWTLAPVEDILSARLRVAELALRRVLGDEADGEAVQELGDLLAEACTVLRPEGRPLYAGHADLPWPDMPVLRMWHAITLLREHRGDGHVAALVTAGVSGIEAIITHTATGRGFTEPAAKLLRGWSDEQWAEAVDGLRARGLLDGDELSDTGMALRDGIEADTDRRALDPWTLLGAERTGRVIELGKQLCRTAVGNGAFPPGVFAAPR